MGNSAGLQECALGHPNKYSAQSWIHMGQHGSFVCCWLVVGGGGRVPRHVNVLFFLFK